MSRILNTLLSARANTENNIQQGNGYIYCGIVICCLFLGLKKAFKRLDLRKV